MLSSMKSGAREIAKRTVFTALGSGPWLRRRLRAVENSGASTILNLHRVAPDDGSSYRPLAPHLFDELLSFVKRDFAIVTIGQLHEPSNKPKLVLSFDDGYQDFARYTVPLLKKHGLRANQNIIPRCVETGLPPLNVVAQDFIGTAPKQMVDALHIDGYVGPRDHRFGGQFSHFLKMRSQAEQDRIASDLMPQFDRWEEFVPTPMMSLAEIKQLDEHELGAHSFSHSSMEFETPAFLDDDVRRCREFFKDQLSLPMSIYAFPNGSCAQGQAERVLELGVDHVLLVGERFDRGQAIHHRFTFDGRSRSEIRFKALGGRGAL